MKYFPSSLCGLLRGQIDREGLSKRRRKGGKKKKEETLQDEGAAEEKGQLLFLSYGNGNEVGHGARDNRGPQAGWASPCKLLPVREPFSPHFYWLTSHLQANYKEASPSKLEAAAVCGVQIGFSQDSSHLTVQRRPAGCCFKTCVCVCVFIFLQGWAMASACISHFLTDAEMLAQVIPRASPVTSVTQFQIQSWHQRWPLSDVGMRMRRCEADIVL